MITVQPCQHCGAAIEFEADGFNGVAECPGCGRENRFQKKIQITPPPPPAPALPEIRRLEPCPDCGGQISTASVFCPHCGGYRRIPFRMVWTAICTFALANFILAVLGGIILWIIHEMST